MNEKQKQEIIKMYASIIEDEADVNKRVRQIEKLKDMFSVEIADWETRLRNYAEKKSFLGVICALELWNGHTPPIPKKQDNQEKIPSELPYYTPKTPEEIESITKDINDRRMRYAILMYLADSMYKQNKIDLEQYYDIQEIFSDFFGFPETSIFYWNGPHQGEKVEMSFPKKRRTYTRRNLEYWEKYEKKHKK